jgi:hypothetical protein
LRADLFGSGGSPIDVGTEELDTFESHLGYCLESSGEVAFEILADGEEHESYRDSFFGFCEQGR